MLAFIIKSRYFMQKLGYNRIATKYCEYTSHIRMPVCDFSSALFSKLFSKASLSLRFF